MASSGQQGGGEGERGRKRALERRLGREVEGEEMEAKRGKYEVCTTHVSR